MISITTNNAPSLRARWLKRASLAGFWFFFIKGLLWLAAPLVFYYAV